MVAVKYSQDDEEVEEKVDISERLGE